MLDPRVTEHAVLGWLRLVENFDLKAQLRRMAAEGLHAATSRAILGHLEKWGAVDVAAVCAAMLTPSVIVALEAGAVSAQLYGHRLNFRGGMVVSVAEAIRLGRTMHLSDARRRGPTRKASRRRRDFEETTAEA